MVNMHMLNTSSAVWSWVQVPVQSNQRLWNLVYHMINFVRFLAIFRFSMWIIRKIIQHLYKIWHQVSSPPVFSGVCVTWSLVLCVMFCRSLFVFLSFFFWPLCCLSFDVRILINPGFGIFKLLIIHSLHRIVGVIPNG